MSRATIDLQARQFIGKKAVVHTAPAPNLSGKNLRNMPGVPLQHEGIVRGFGTRGDAFCRTQSRYLLLEVPGQKHPMEISEKVIQSIELPTLRRININVHGSNTH